MATDQIIGNRNPICVVVDTCVWRSQLLLRTSVGKSMVYTLKLMGGHIGLPEIVERELSSNIAEAIAENLNSLTLSLRRLETVTGVPQFPPSEVNADDVVEQRLTELDDIIVRVELTLKHTRAALDMVDAHLPPNSESNQQFKDSAIWQAVLQLSTQYDVHLVTSDRAFLKEKKDPTKGLADNLVADCSGSVRVFCDLATCLKHIDEGDQPNVDETKISELLLPLVLPQIKEVASRRQAILTSDTKVSLKIFSTRDEDRFAIDYTVTAECVPDILRNEIEVVTVACGTATYEEPKNQLSGNLLDDVFVCRKLAGGGHSWSGSEFSTLGFTRPRRWDYETMSFRDE